MLQIIKYISVLTRNIMGIKMLALQSSRLSCLLFVASIFAPSIALTDRDGICEEPNCGEGAINSIFSALLILAFWEFFGFKRAGIFYFFGLHQ